MPTPPPPEEHRWKPGQSGNPAGYSRSRRLSDKLIRLIEEKDLDKALVTTWLAMALGDKESLKGRKPEFAWFKELLERVEGKVPDRVITDDDSTRGPHTIDDDDPRLARRGERPAVERSEEPDVAE